MAKPKVVHLIVDEPEERIAGMRYLTLCDIYWEHQPLSPEEARERFICAMCQNEQNLELAKALENLRDRYNFHLTHSHLKEDEH